MSLLIEGDKDFWNCSHMPPGEWMWIHPLALPISQEKAPGVDWEWQISPIQTFCWNSPSLWRWRSNALELRTPVGEALRAFTLTSAYTNVSDCAAFSKKSSVCVCAGACAGGRRFFKIMWHKTSIDYWDIRTTEKLLYIGETGQQSLLLWKRLWLCPVCPSELNLGLQLLLWGLAVKSPLRVATQLNECVKTYAIG